MPGQFSIGTGGQFSLGANKKHVGNFLSEFLKFAPYMKNNAFKDELVATKMVTHKSILVNGATNN